MKATTGGVAKATTPKTAAKAPTKSPTPSRLSSANSTSSSVSAKSTARSTASGASAKSAPSLAPRGTPTVVVDASAPGGANDDGGGADVARAASAVGVGVGVGGPSVVKTVGGFENMRVFVRVRPLNPMELRENQTSVVQLAPELCSARIEVPGRMPHNYTFDGVFGEESTQKQIYSRAAANVIDGVLEGFNGTIFAYGQTASGKTYTMSGGTTEDDKGIIPHAIDHIFHHIAQDTSREFVVSVACLEIYCEKITDLLGKSEERLKLRLDEKGKFQVQGLKPRIANNPAAILKKMNKANDRRHVGKTNMNERSSRSHSIFQIIIESKKKNSESNDVLKAKLNLVDLAGSERQKKTQAEGKRLQEATKINLSLMVLVNVINALVAGSGKHVPYRESNLTKLLEDSLGGNTRCTMMANCSPASSNADETANTLAYAHKAKQIKNKPQKNADGQDGILAQLQEQIRMLNEELKRIEDSRPVGEAARMAEVSGNSGVSPELLMNLRFEKDEKIKEALAKANVAQSERDRIYKQLKDMQEEDEKQRREIDTVKSKLKNTQDAICVGGVNLLDENARQSAELLQAQNEIEMQKAKEAQLLQELQAEEEAALFKEEMYKSVEDEIAKKTAKAEKVFATLKSMQEETEVMKAQFEEERDLLLDSIRELERDCSFQDLIIDYFIPPEYRNLIEENARPVEGDNTWALMHLGLAGNRVSKHSTWQATSANEMVILRDGDEDSDPGECDAEELTLVTTQESPYLSYNDQGILSSRPFYSPPSPSPSPPAYQAAEPSPRSSRSSAASSSSQCLQEQHTTQPQPTRAHHSHSPTPTSRPQSAHPHPRTGW
ncbi:kinesin-II 85 kDa subunit [Pelomyxa schiedti]|nr:kinesin-II 85 kDa subunit [Pelomyxa schiedti]